MRTWGTNITRNFSNDLSYGERIPDNLSDQLVIGKGRKFVVRPRMESDLMSSVISGFEIRCPRWIVNNVNTNYKEAGFHRLC
jgi:hypothetical protein